jgi:hypothetical protein
MATTINASASSGLITTADTSTILQLQTGGTTAVTVDASQNVGIGTASPVLKLDVSGKVKFTGVEIAVSEDYTTNLYYSGGWKYRATGYGTTIGASSGAITFNNTASSGTADAAATLSERMRIDSSGNVGIGTTSQFASSSVTVRKDQNASTRISVKNDDTGSSGGAAFVMNAYGNSWVVECGSAAKNSNALTFALDATASPPSEKMRLDTSGNLLVGKTSTNFTTQGIEFRANGSSYITSTLTDTLTLYNKTSTSGDSILAGFSNVTSTAAVKFLIQASGTCLNATGTYGTYSDAKLKENIVDASSKLEKIMDLQVRNYNLIGDDLKQIGFVAQEFEQVFPSMVEETVDKDADGVELGTTTKAIKTTVLIPVLVKAIQEQQALITQLQADVAALKGA